MEKEKFDLVLLDLHMPVMGGLETAKNMPLHPDMVLPSLPWWL